MIVEADSKLIIKAVKRISWGIKPKKVTRNWRLIQGFQQIQHHLQSLCIVSFKHVRRIANKLVDLLANQGVISTEHRVAMSWQELPQSRLKANFHDQEDEDRIVFRGRAMVMESS